MNLLFSLHLYQPVFGVIDCEFDPQEKVAATLKAAASATNLFVNRTDNIDGLLGCQVG